MSKLTQLLSVLNDPAVTGAIMIMGKVLTIDGLNLSVCIAGHDAL